MKIQKPTIVVVETGHLSKTFISGGDSLIQGMSSYLQDKYHLEIILPRMASHQWKNQQGFSFYKIPSVISEKNKNHFNFFLTYLWRMFHTYRYLLTKQGDFIIYSSTNHFVDVWPCFFVRLFQKNLSWVARVHHLVQPPQKRSGIFFINFVSFLLDRFSLQLIKTATIIIPLNSTLEKQLIKLQFKKSKLHILGAGIQYMQIRNIPFKKRTPSFEGIFVGRLHGTKGVMDLPVIWQQVKLNLPKAKLAIIGELSDKNLEKALKEKIRELDLTKNIKVLGFLKYSDLISHLKKSKVFLFTDHEAGWGLAVAEAMAAGLPIIGWDIGVLGSVFKKGYIKINQNDLKSFSEKITFLLSNERIRTKMAKDAKLEAVKLDWDQTSVKFSKILDKIIP